MSVSSFSGTPVMVRSDATSKGYWIIFMAAVVDVVEANYDGMTESHRNVSSIHSERGAPFFRMCARSTSQNHLMLMFKDR